MSTITILAGPSIIMLINWYSNFLQISVATRDVVWNFYHLILDKSRPVIRFTTKQVFGVIDLVKGRREEMKEDPYCLVSAICRAEKAKVSNGK